MWTLPELEQLTAHGQAIVKQVKKGRTPLELQRKAIEQTAMSYGAQGGMAWRAREIDQQLDQVADRLDTIYDFQRLALPGNVLPPVIESGREASVFHADTLRTSIQDYRIVIPARFVSVLPTWRGYLELHYRQPTLSDIPEALLPRTAVQRSWWRDAAAKGWEAGEQEADALFENDLDRMTRDITGMIRYRQLLMNGEVKPPMIEKANLGVERDQRVMGRASRMQVGVTLHRITLPAGFANPHHWQVLPR